MDSMALKAERKYHIDFSVSELFKRVNKILNPTNRYNGTFRWQLLDKGDNYRLYTLNPKWHFLINSMVDLNDITKIKSDQKKYDDFSMQKLTTYLHDFLASLRYNVPFCLRLMIINSTGSDAVIIAECFSVMYEMIDRNIAKPKDFQDFEKVTCKYECEKFLDRIFLSERNGKIIIEKNNQKFEDKLFVNNGCREITPLIDSLLTNATGEILICGWIGTQFIPQMIKLINDGIKIRLITHQPSEAKNQPWRSEIQKAFQQLCDNLGKENICVDPTMHGRILIVDNKAIVGSMDLTSASLIGPHTEFAIYTERPEIVKRLRRIFNFTFKPMKLS